LRFGLIREFCEQAERLTVVAEGAEAFASLSKTNQVLIFT
tara:strand:- start:451 stop:570 length:120 start_codon:yes stop_codon:yes gene_type:complete